MFFKAQPMLGIFNSSYNKEISNNLLRGLFFDLTDAGNNIESNFNNVQGISTNDIYQLLTQDIYTIQEFRDLWELTYPSVDNNDLFNEYNVN